MHPFSENLNVSIVSKLILFEIPGIINLVYSGYNHEEERKKCSDRKQNVDFLMHVCKHDIISGTRLFSASKGENFFFRSVTNF